MKTIRIKHLDCAGMRRAGAIKVVGGFAVRDTRAPAPTPSPNSEVEGERLLERAKSNTAQAIAEMSAAHAKFWAAEPPKKGAK
jgi:hypothetical protein